MLKLQTAQRHDFALIMSNKVKKEQAEAIALDFKKLGVRATLEQDLSENNEV